MVAVGIGAANATQSLLNTHGFNFGFTELETVAVGGRGDDAAFTPNGPHRLLGMEGDFVLQLLEQGGELFLFLGLSIARDGCGEGLDKHVLPSLFGDLQKATKGGKGHKTDIGHNDGGIAASHIILHEIAVGDVIDIVTILDDGLDGLDELGGTLFHRVNIEKCDSAWLVVYHVVIRKIDKHIVVGFAPLEE